MTNEKYNGWTNYETWLCNLWIDNDQGTQQMFHEWALEAYNNAEKCDICTKKQNAQHDHADALKGFYEDQKAEYDSIKGAFDVGGFFSDLASASLSIVNWNEIAEHHINDALEAQEYAA
jgi:hypothetical protein